MKTDSNNLVVRNLRVYLARREIKRTSNDVNNQANLIEPSVFSASFIDDLMYVNRPELTLTEVSAWGGIESWRMYSASKPRESLTGAQIDAEVVVDILEATEDALGKHSLYWTTTQIADFVSKIYAIYRQSGKVRNVKRAIGLIAKKNVEFFKHCRKAAEQGDATAQYNLGTMYFEGEGVPQDHAEAWKWFRRAAEQGDATAQYNLGVYYFENGGPQDFAEAYAWNSLAAASGNEDAIHNLDLIACKLTSARLKEGKKRAAELSEKIAQQKNRS